MRFGFLMICLLWAVKPVLAIGEEIHPKNNDSLNYRLIGFTLPRYDGANHYRLEVFEEDSMAKKKAKPIITKESDSNRFIATVPSFGKRYTWQITYLKGKKAIGHSNVHSFFVLHNPFADSPASRVVVVDSAQKYNDLLVFYDNTRGLYNMAGEAVWFLPVMPGISDSTAQIRDMKMTQEGTITFMTNSNVYEIDYDAHVLWAGPNNGAVSGDSVEHYHHEFTKLPNGRYMVIGNKMIQEGATDLPAIKGKPGMEYAVKVSTCGTVIEYNKEKEVVWTWNSCEHGMEDDHVTHFNGCYFDTMKKVIYTSYRNTSNIVKAAYPSGKVLAKYGSDSRFGKKSDGGNGMFYAQHHCSINSDGNLVIFNNNYNMMTWRNERDNSVPTVAVFEEPKTTSDTFKRVWEFATDIDTLVKPLSTGGGSAYELDKGDYLVCTGLPGRNFIVSADKQILWNVLVQKYDKGWKPLQGYRVSPVYSKDLWMLLFK